MIELEIYSNINNMEVLTLYVRIITHMSFVFIFFLVQFIFFRHVYLYCESAKTSEKGFEFEIKPYSPSNTNLQDIASKLKMSNESDATSIPPWLNYLREALNTLRGQADQDFSAPSADTDKLYMSIGARDLIEVAHPVPLDKTVKR